VAPGEGLGQGMNFELTERQQSLREQMSAFGATLYSAIDASVIDADARGAFDSERWAACAQQGLLGLNVPEDCGGRGLCDLDTAIALEGFGHGCPDNGLVFAISTQIVSVIDTLMRFGTDAIKAQYIEPSLRGDSIGCYAITEQNAGSDCFALETTARADGNGWRISGVKQLITFAPVADYAIVFASTNPDAGSWGISAFVIDCAQSGVSRSAVQQKMGLRTVPIGQLEFDDVYVSEEACLGSVGSGASIFNATQETERALILAGQIGAMQRQLDETIAFARQRKQFGQSVGSFQSVSNRIVDMKLKLETSRLLLYKTAWLRDQGQSHMLEASLTNVHLAESFMEASLNALTIRGGRGYLTETGVERDLRDAVGGSLYGGTSDIQRQIVARLLGL